VLKGKIAKCKRRGKRGMEAGQNTKEPRIRVDNGKKRNLEG
jgi:hypothetical protein